jgi:PKD repeat protein/N-acetyl-anhydromuramyl-L-alanine amidase AmpD
MKKKFQKLKRCVLTTLLLSTAIFSGFAQNGLKKEAVSDAKLYALAESFIKSPIKKTTNKDGEVFLQRNMDAYLGNSFKIKNTKHREDEPGCNHNDQMLSEFLNRPHPSVGTMIKYFNQSAKEFNVPVEILMAVGQVQSNWAQVSTSEYGSWGVMGLIENNNTQQITLAAQLTNTTTDDIKNNAKANIRAAAALLALYQKNKIPSSNVTDWYESVKELTGLRDEAMKISLTNRFYKVINDGSKTISLWKEIITINSKVIAMPKEASELPSKTNKTSNNSKTGAVAAVDYVGALSRITSCNYGVGRNGYGKDYYFVHYMATGTYEGAISYFNDCSRTTPSSAHYCIRNSDGQISQVVREADRAYSQGVTGEPQWNGAGISTEHEVLATNLAMWDSQPMLDAAGNLARDVCNRYGISKTRRVVKGDRAIYGHNDVKTSTDCPNLTTTRWNNLLTKIQGGATIPATPTALTAVANSGSQITLTWADNSTNETGFIIERSLTSGSGFSAIFTSAANATSYVNTGISASTKYYYRIKATNASGSSVYTAEASATTYLNNCIPPVALDSYVDNVNSAFVGSWTIASSTAGYYGVDYAHDGDALKGTKTATFTPNLPQRGRYEIFVNHTAGANRASNVPFDIYNESGVSTVLVNQQINNGVWVSLGTFNLDAGNTHKVVIRTDGTSGVVIADAVRFKFIDCLPGVLPVANFTSSASTVCLNNTISYTNTSTDATSYSWTFNGGTPSTSTEVNPIITYNTPGTYNVSLIATNSDGSNTKTITNAIIIKPTSSIALTSAVGSDNQTLCLSNPIANITYSIGGSATGATVTGLPSGLSGSFASGIFTISGTSTVDGTYNYTVTTTGGCTTPSLNGTITIKPVSSIVLTSAVGTDNQTLCISNSIANIAFSVGGSATGATATGLPAGITGSFASGTYTISGTSTAAGTFNYTVSTTGGCTTPSLNGTIIIKPVATIALTSAIGTDNQNICTSNPISNITYSIGGSATGATVTGLPTGITGSFASGIFTISGTSSSTGTFNYTVTTTSGCTTPSLNGTITLNPIVPITAGFTAPYSELSTGEVMTLTNTSTGATTYSWTFPNGSPATSTATNPTVSFTTTGTKTITLVATNNCSSSTYTFNVCVGSVTTSTLETFETNAGRFTSIPTTSGSTVGIATTSTLARATDSFKNGVASLKAVLNDNTSVTTNWLVRLLSGGGTPANNLAFPGNQGSFGFWLKTSTANAGATVTAWIDDVDGLEELPPLPIINNGTWNYYEWFLPTAVGTTITTGNGLIGGASVTLDAIVIKQNNTATTMTVWIDDIGHKYISSCSGNRKTASTLGTEEVIAEEIISLYPNPSKGYVTIKQSNASNSKLNIYNTLGQKIIEKDFNDSELEIDLNQYTSGMYIFQIVTDDKVVTKKLLLNK